MWGCNYLSSEWIIGASLALAAAVLIGLLLSRDRGGASRKASRHDQADSMEILRIRYARGEVDEETYCRMRDTLRQSRRGK